MPTTFANSIDSNPIYAQRAEQDASGNNIAQTYATKSELPSVPVTDVTVDGVSVVSSGTAAITMPTIPVTDVEVDGSSVVSGGVASITIPAQVQADWTEADSSDPSYIANKPSLSTVATTGDYDDLSDKPDLSIYAETANLATVATTGSYDDLADKPTIPAAQVNSDWNSNSGVSQILNKPTLSTVATTGDYNDLSNKPSIPAAQVNADWNSSSGVSEILNKPTLAAVATSGDYSDLSGTPTINNVPAVTSSDDNKVLKASYTGGVGSYSWETETGTTYSAGTGIDIDQNNEISVENPLPASTSAEAGKYLKVNASGSPEWATGGGGGGGVNADWDETDPLEPSYIENKPTPKTLTAGANISISEGVGTLTISAAAGLPASTSADEGKCLVVDSNGDPEWGTGGKTYTGTDGVVVDNVNDTVGLEAPVDIVAGPGIAIDNPDGNTVRVSLASTPYNETVLWTPQDANGDNPQSITLSENYTNFDHIVVYYRINDGDRGSLNILPVTDTYWDMTTFANYSSDTSTSANNIAKGCRLFLRDGNKLTKALKIWFQPGNSAPVQEDHTVFYFLKVVGINRIAGGN